MKSNKSINIVDIDFSTAFWQGKSPLTDSRQLISGNQGMVFFALKGKTHDGHQFIHPLYQKGIRHFVVSQPVAWEDYPGAAFLWVEDPLACLQAWARWHRKQYSLPVIGITGSNGKTMVKEWLFQLLQPDQYIVKSPKSYNSQLGVPLSILAIQAQHELGIFEAGISTTQEMKKLAPIIQPQIGIFTNIGLAHAEGFANQKEKIQEKLQLFNSVDTLIYNCQYEDLDQEIQASYPNKKLLRWGRGEGATIPVDSHQKNASTIQLSLTWQSEQLNFHIPFRSAAAVENVTHCLVLLLHLGYSPNTIQQRIDLLRDVPMRLEWKEGIQGSMLVDDTYNNDLRGIKVALDFMLQKHASLIQEKQSNRKTVILSDSLESGIPEDALYTEIAQLMYQAGINRFVGIGPNLYEHRDKFSRMSVSTFYKDTDSFLAANLAYRQETILIKGARSFEFERIVQHLRKRSHATVLELNLGALLHNFNVYKSLVKPETKLMVMVKASAYGSSSYEVARLLEYHKADYLGVAYTDEGMHLREKGIKIPIMVMNANSSGFSDLITYQLEPAIYSLEMLQELLVFLQIRKISRPLAVHIELDSGMHRLGFVAEELERLVLLLKAHPGLIRPVGVFSHLVAADEAKEQLFSLQQLEQFAEFSQQLEQALGVPLLKHMLNSAGISRFPDWQFDMVRLGIGLHGMDPNVMIQQQLEPVATLRSVVSQVKPLAAGDSVGYGRHSVSEHPRTIATIAIGYADGLMRAYGNGLGYVKIRGQNCPLVGNICMDMCFADVTGLDVRAGDDVLIFGKNLPIQKVSKLLNTIPYELLAHVSSRVPRVFYEE